MPKLTTTEWWRRRICRWIDLARKDARRGEGRRYKAPTHRAVIAARMDQLKANKRDVLTLDHRRRRSG